MVAAGRFRIQTIRTRLFLALVIATTTLMGMLGLIWRVTVEPQLRLDVAENQREIARRAADQIETFIERRISELIAATELGQLWRDHTEGQKEVLQRLLKLAPTVQEVALADREGQVVARLSRTHVYANVISTSMAGEERFLQAVRGRIYIGDVYHAPTAEPLVSVAVPVKFTTFDVWGVLTAEINLNTLWDPIAHITVGRSGSAFVVDRAGRLIAHKDYSNVLLRLSMADHPAVREALAHPTRDRQLGEILTGQDGTPLLSTFAVVTRPRWIVVVEEPVDTALIAVYGMEWLAMGLLLPILAGTFALSYWFSERVGRPIRELQREAALISQGNLGHRLQISTGDEIEALANQFNHMADQLRLSHDDLERRVAEKTRDLSALYALTSTIGRSGQWPQVIDDAMVKILDVTEVNAVSLHVLEEDGGRFARASLHGFAEGPPPEILGEPWSVAVRELLRTIRAPLFAADLAQHPELPQRLLAAAGFRSAVFLPLQTSEKVLGLMTLASREPGQLNPRQEELFSAIARQFSMTIEKARLYHEAADRSAQLTLLAHVNRVIASSRDTGEVLQQIASATIQLMNAAYASFWIADETTQTLEVGAFSDNAGGGASPVSRLRFGEGAVGWVAAHRQLLNIPDIAADERLTPTAWVEAQGFTSWLGVPVMLEDTLLAVLALFGRQPFRFGADDQALIENFVAQAAVAIRNASLVASEVAAHDAAEAAARHKSELLANLRHELCTPINGIMGMTELALDTELTAEQREYLTTVKGAAHSLLTIVTNPPASSTIESDALDSEAVPFTLHECMDRVLKTLALRADHKGLELCCAIPPEVPDAVVGYPDRLRQILINLIGNAIKFTERGEVVVRVALETRSSEAVCLHFMVQDTGVGIPTQQQRLIFEPLTRTDGATTTPYGGTGLGLAISAWLVHLMGGRLWVESEVGKGSVFHFTACFGLLPALPACQPEPRTPIAEAPVHLSTALNNVDGDRAILAETVEIFLEDYPQQLVELREAISSGDAKRTEQVAYGLKGVIGIFGAQQAYDLACELEMLGRTNQMQDAPRVLERLQGALQQITAFFAESNWMDHR